MKNLQNKYSDLLSFYSSINWTEVNGDTSGAHSTSIKIKFKTAMPRQILCN